MAMRDGGPRRWRSRRLLILAAVPLIATIMATGAAGCGSGSTAATAPGGLPGRISTTVSPMMEAYYRAHPGLVDGVLQPAPATPEKILADIRSGLDHERDIWLPEYLPDGFVLAAPYNGDGSGSAYPNPYAWGRGYGVTYTDGAGYIMVLSNSDDDLAQGEWTALTETVAGRHLRLQSGSGVTLVATSDDGDVPLLVAGAGFAGERLAAELIRVATSLRHH
ncbi:MAG: hypothetical protein V1912_02480 [bacterium]